ncbi:MAG: hypothetical protein ACOCUO_02670 [archaeon]
MTRRPTRCLQPLDDPLTQSADEALFETHREYLVADLDRDEFERGIGMLEEQATSGHPANSDRFCRAIDDLEER